MGAIYSSAKVVHIWLGEGNKQTDRAMGYLATGALPFRCFITAKAEKRIPTGITMSWRLAIHLFFRVLTFRKAPYFSGLKDIFDREWINRMWTLQELFLARNCTIVCGEKAISWTAMAYSLRTIEFFAARREFITFPHSCRLWIRLMAFWLDVKERMARQGNDDCEESRLTLHEKFIQKG